VPWLPLNGVVANPSASHCLPRRYAEDMLRGIENFRLDEQGDWVAELVCGHNQHVRHQPPFQLREWVTHAEGRRMHIGTLLPCPLCDRAELPDALRFERSSRTWTEDTLPAGLKKSHRLAAGTWGLIRVASGQLRFSAKTIPELDIMVTSGMTQPIPPEVEHEVCAIGPVGFSIDFLSILQGKKSPETEEESIDISGSLPIEDQGGEAACMAHLLCPECGVVMEGSSHAIDCRTNEVY
jgi:tellurite methyltransferase